MFDYNTWNDAIFNYFFNEENNGQEIIFSFDEVTLNQIGNDLALSENNCLKDFCGSVSKKIIAKNRRNENVLRLNKISTNSPDQTAILALFVLAASRMHPDNEQEISSRNYNVRLKELLEIGIDETCITKIYACDTQIYLNLWEKLEEYLNINKNGTLGKVTFKGLFKKNDARNDLVGIPILQSMIAMQDMCYLTEIFNKTYNEEIKEKDLTDYPFSRRFNAVLNNGSLKDKLLLKIKKLREDWDGTLLEIDQFGKIKRNPVLNFAFKKTRKFNMFLVIGANKDLVDQEELNFENPLLNNVKKSLYYEEFNPIKISLSDFSKYNNNLIFNELGSGVNFVIKKRDFVLFKNNENISLNVQVPNINLGDTFSIIVHKRIWNEIFEELTLITDESSQKILSQRTSLDDTNYFILTNLKANKLGNGYILVKSYKKINLVKGLKLDRKTYLKGAEPIIEISMPKNFEPFDILIDNKKIKYSDPIKLKDYQEFCNTGVIHEIKISGDYEKYSISEVDTIFGQSIPFIYHILDKNDCTFIDKQQNFTENQININGTNICNLDMFFLRQTFKKAGNLDKVYYILSIINTLNVSNSKNGFINSRFNVIKKEIVDNLKRIDNKKLKTNFNNYFFNKTFTSNIELEYLQEINKEIKAYLK